MNNSFQTILIGVFIVAAVVGVAIFALGGLNSGNKEQVNVSFTVWGEWESDTFNNLLKNSGIADMDGIIITYESVPAGQLETRLVNALARGRGPDVLLMSHTQLLQLSDLISSIGSGAYSSRMFRDTFIEGAEIFTSSEGISALPLAMDPLVMYWNRDIVTQAGFLSPPSNWQEVADYARQITRKAGDDSIQTAALNFGTAGNVTALTEVLSSLFLQAGNPIVTRISADRFETVLSQNIQSAESAVGLYTQYANPNSSVYSWNSSMPADRQEFTSGNLALYVAPASSISYIRSQNPNLNFDVSVIPQLEEGLARTHATVYGFAILNQAPNKLTILEALKLLTGPDMARAIVNQTNFTPVRRDVLSQQVTDPYQQVFHQSALISRGWLDPDPEATDSIFSEMISNINSGRLPTRSAIQRAETSLGNLF
ncbi:MAG: extracellular solute-binding protein [Candidatus Paceibacterota bacterium]